MFETLLETRDRVGIENSRAVSTAVAAHAFVVSGLALAAILAQVSFGPDPPLPFQELTILLASPSPLGDSPRAGGGGDRVHAPPPAEPPRVIELTQPLRIPEATPPAPAVSPAEPSPVSEAPAEPEGPPGQGSGDGSGPGAGPGTYGSRTGFPGGTDPVGDRGDGPGSDSILRPGGDVTEPISLERPLPEYPYMARATRTQGTVVLEGVIGLDGRVESLRVLQSIRLLDEAAIRAVERWRYKPATRDGAPVKVYLTILVEFHLN